MTANSGYLFRLAWPPDKTAPACLTQPEEEVASWIPGAP
jgi:hypothetical protein